MIRSTHTRVSLCAAVLLLALAAWTSLGTAASSTTVIGASVPSATTLSTTGCPPLDATRTSLGTLTPGSGAITTADCDVLFGSSNDAATLRTYQSDGRSNAMATDPTTKTETLTGNRVFDLDMASAAIGYSVGDGTTANRVRKTTDGGATWSTLTTTIGGSARAVSAPTTTDVWVARYSTNAVIRSTDGGSTWLGAVPLPQANDRAFNMSATSAANAWIAGSGVNGSTTESRIWRTTDGGTTWNIVCNACTASQFTDIQMLPGTTTGWATTQNGEVWNTTNGSTWTLQLTLGNSFQAIDARDANNVIAVGAWGQVYASVNGGSSWNNRSIAQRATLRDVTYLAGGVAWATGDNGLVVRSTDSGVTWSVIPSRAEGSSIDHVEATSATTMVGANWSEGFIRTSDTGATWSVATSVAGTTSGPQWTDLAAADGARMWRVGSAGAIEATTDGTTWVAQTSGTTEALYGVAELDRQRLVAVGSNGTILRTTNGGTTWASVASGTTSTIRAVAALGDGRVWAVGDGGLVLRSLDDGASFTALTSGTTEMLTTVSARSTTDVWIGSAAAVVRRSTDAGATWSTITTPAGAWIASIDAVPGSSVAWVVAGTYVYRTTNDGSTWSSSTAGNGISLYEVDALDATTAYSVGRFGTMRRTLDGGTTWTTFTGGSGTRAWVTVVALGRDSAFAVGEGSAVLVDPGTGVPDYDGAAASWTGSGFFGICLRAAPSTGSTWPTDGTCDQANGTEWRAIPAYGSLASAPAASTLAPGTTTASFRFGMKTPSSQAPGTYTAPVTFEVTAPAG